MSKCIEERYQIKHDFLSLKSTLRKITMHLYQGVLILAFISKTMIPQNFLSYKTPEVKTSKLAEILLYFRTPNCDLQD